MIGPHPLQDAIEGKLAASRPPRLQRKDLGIQRRGGFLAAPVVFGAAPVFAAACYHTHPALLTGLARGWTLEPSSHSKLLSPCVMLCTYHGFFLVRAELAVAWRVESSSNHRLRSARQAPTAHSILQESLRAVCTLCTAPGRHIHLSCRCLGINFIQYLYARRQNAIGSLFHLHNQLATINPSGS